MIWSYLLAATCGPFLVQAVASRFADTHSQLSQRETTPALLPSQSIAETLGSILSKDTEIFLPTDDNWASETERYQNYDRPRIQLAVRPGLESDVSKIIKYANSVSVNFLAVNRGHSLTSTVGKFNGIEIDLRGLTDISVNKGGKTARYQAGVYGHEVLNTLWDQGYVGGILGPALGGGHTAQQGVHGLISDHIESMNVVLADGRAITVSKNKNKDLWWAMRGAGHNFGVVTSFHAKIWPAVIKSYFYRTYTFKGDRLESLFRTLNTFHNNGTTPTEWLGAWGVFTMDRTVDKNKAVIIWTFVYAGEQKRAERLLKPFDRVGPVSHVEGNVPYPEVNDQLGGGVDSFLCTPNKTHVIGTAGLQVYNVSSERAIYELYNQKVSKHPVLGDTRVVHEGYAVKGVSDIKAEDSAYPLRDDYLLMYFDTTPTPESGLVPFAQRWALDTVNLWNSGQPKRKPTTYVNYAAGHESLESMYGYEPWRLDRLRRLKDKYDPHNRFAYYNPITPPGDD
ncbi:hypothetical protein FAVG1_08720 [Fusarium avenaceum]|nr:hypothetical protein FAVG1_08720 [Fusarium avenaceum]